MLPLLFASLLKHRGRALGWRPLNLIWSEGHVNRGTPVSLTGSAGTPQKPTFVPISKLFWKGGASGGTCLPALTRPVLPPGLMYDSRWSCGTKWIPWHDAHERGLLGFFFNLYSYGKSWCGTCASFPHHALWFSSFLFSGLVKKRPVSGANLVCTLFLTSCEFVSFYLRVS